MLKRLFITSVAAALALACVSNGSGQLRRTQRPAQRTAAPTAAKPAAHPVLIDAKLGDAFPDDTFMYGEIGDLASVVEQVAGDRGERVDDSVPVEAVVHGRAFTEGGE